MKPQSYTIFSTLCENLMLEVSSVTGVMPKNPAVNELLRILHVEHMLPHDQKFEKIKTITWKSIADTEYGGWILMEFSNGAAAIHAIRERGGYEVITVNTDSGEPVPSFERFTSGTTLLNYIKTTANLRQLQNIYSGLQSEESVERLEKRERRRAEILRSGTLDINDLFKKFKPLWVKSVIAAQADIKGMAATMIQNNSFTKASAKLGRLQDLNRVLDELEDYGGNFSRGHSPARELLKNSVKAAIILTASHFYPEATGEITRRYSSEYQPESRAGSYQVLHDISNGDGKKLATVLAFFRKVLVSGM